MKNIIALILISVFINSVSFAEIYRCVDSQGKVRHTTSPGPGCTLLPESVPGYKTPDQRRETKRNENSRREISRNISYAINLCEVKIGSKIHDQKEKIKEINKNYILSEYKIKNRIYIDASYKKNDFEYDYFTVSSDDNGVVIFIARKQKFQIGERIKPEIFLETLSNKFINLGKFLPYPDKYLDKNKKGYMLQIDYNGESYQGQIKNGPCWNVGFVPYSFMRSKMHGIDEIMFVPNKINEKCGISIRAVINEDESTGLIDFYEISIFDNKKIFDEYRQKEIEEDIERKKIIDLEVLKINKPSL